MKDFTSTMDVVMSPEEKAAMEEAAKAEAEAAAPTSAADIGKAAEAATSAPADTAAGTAAGTTASGATSPGKTTPEGSSTDLTQHTGKKEYKDKGKTKLTPEQKAKLDELETQKEKERKARCVFDLASSCVCVRA